MLGRVFQQEVFPGRISNLWIVGEVARMCFPMGLFFLLGKVKKVESVSQLGSFFPSYSISNLRSISQMGSAYQFVSVCRLESISQLGSVSKLRRISSWEAFFNWGVDCSLVCSSWEVFYSFEVFRSWEPFLNEKLNPNSRHHAGMTKWGNSSQNHQH